MSDDQPPEWFTALQAHSFAIGDEVVITLHGECPRGVHHGDQEIGVRGTVIGLDGGNGAPAGHTVWVHFRHPLPVRGSSWYYAPGELQAFDLVESVSERIAR